MVRLTRKVSRRRTRRIVERTRERKEARRKLEREAKKEHRAYRVTYAKLYGNIVKSGGVGVHAWIYEHGADEANDQVPRLQRAVDQTIAMVQSEYDLDGSWSYIGKEGPTLIEDGLEHPIDKVQVIVVTWDENGVTVDLDTERSEIANSEINAWEKIAKGGR